MSDSEIDNGKEIEEKIVTELARRHTQFIGDNPGKWIFTDAFGLFCLFPITQERPLDFFRWGFIWNLSEIVMSNNSMSKINESELLCT